MYWIVAHATLANFAHIGFLRHNWVSNLQIPVSSSQHLIMVGGTPNTHYLDCSACHDSHDSVNHYMVLNPLRRRYLHLGRCIAGFDHDRNCTRINFVNFITPCFTSRHHVITNKIHDLTTLRASYHECFDYIKTLHTSCRRSYRSLHHNFSSLRLASHQYRHASVLQL